MKKGFKAYRGAFGVYCFTGKQGTAKTFNAVEFLSKRPNAVIYSNIHLNDIDYTYYSGLNELVNINPIIEDGKQIIIFFDEIFSELTKSSRISTEVLSFLSQQRKRGIIFLTTAQEWLEIPVTLRRYVRFQIDCSIINIFPFSIAKEVYHNAELMKWSNEENEYIAPIISTKIKKMSKKITQFYDTFEVIQSGR